jgi:hypothetical protein
MKIAEGAPGVEEAGGEIEDRVSPSRLKESGLGVTVGVGLAAALVGTGRLVRWGSGVLSGEALGVKAVAVASAKAAGGGVNSVTIGPAVGGVSAGEQPVKRMMVRNNAGQTFVTNCR